MTELENKIIADQGQLIIKQKALIDKLITSLFTKKQESVWICGKCNHENDQDLTNCTKCGEFDDSCSMLHPIF